MGQKIAELDPDDDNSREEDFEALLEKQASVGDSEWKADKQQPTKEADETQKPPTETPAPNAEEVSSNGSNTSEIPEQEKQLERIGAFDVDAAYGDLSAQEVEILKASQSPDAPEDPNLLETLLQMDMAKQMVSQHSISKVTVIPTDDPKNPGWVVENLIITTKTTEELDMLDDLDAVYKRIGYECDKLTLDQQCEVLDKVQLHLQFVIREYGARLAHIHKDIKAKKLSAAQAKGYIDDVATKPVSYAQARAKQEARLAPPKPKAPKGLSAAARNQIDTMLGILSVKEIATHFSSKGELTAELAAYLKSKEGK